MIEILKHIVCIVTTLFFFSSSYVFAKAIKDRDFASGVVGLICLILGGLAMVGAITEAVMI